MGKLNVSLRDFISDMPTRSKYNVEIYLSKKHSAPVFVGDEQSMCDNPYMNEMVDTYSFVMNGKEKPLVSIFLE